MKILNAIIKSSSCPPPERKQMFRQRKNHAVNILQKDLRPISLTACASKVAMEFIVEDYLKLSSFTAAIDA